MNERLSKNNITSSPSMKQGEISGHDHDHDHDHSHDHSHVDEGENIWKKYTPAMVSFLLLVAGILFDYFGNHLKTIKFFEQIRFFYYVIPYIIIGFPVLKKAFQSISRNDYFNEFMLMSIATIGAFCIEEYPEGVAVMLFYQIGELFQDAAVHRVRKSIKALLDVRPQEVTVIRDGIEKKINPSHVNTGEVISIKPGEKVALDGDLVNDKSSFNTAALTGESKPDNKYKGEKVLAGMVNLTTLSEVRVTALYKDSKLSQILQMVQDATARKAKTQLFISRFARLYTPLVVLLALLIIMVPMLLVENYQFRDWLYRALVFLVISCPCALVVSIPLGYFGGIGLGSRNGILFKGSNFLDMMTEIDTVVLDKTGTLTKGVFKVQQVVSDGLEKELLLNYTAALELHSTHPIAKAILEVCNINAIPKATSVEEIAGHGLKGVVDGKEVLSGNLKLLRKFNISYSSHLVSIRETMVVTAIDGEFAGYIIIADEIKEDAKRSVSALQELGINTLMLSGDKQEVVDAVAHQLNIQEAYGDLLPQEKVMKIQVLKNQGKKVAFVGDGVNDAPVVAMADAGIAMGGLGADATIETADIVIQNDQPYKVYTSILIGKLTKKIVWQNIVLAFGVKALVLALGAGGMANLWEAVFADVGVALLAILNAVRIQHAKV